jgi:hypothetical protein
VTPEEVVEAVAAHELVGIDTEQLCRCGVKAKSLLEHFGLVALGALGAPLSRRDRLASRRRASIAPPSLVVPG